MRRAGAVVLILTLFALFFCPCAGAETADWDRVAEALLADEEHPVPKEWLIPVNPGDLSRREGLDPRVMNILLLSTDAADIADNLGRTDLMILCSVNLAEGTILLLSLPETAYVRVEGLPEKIRAKFVNCFGGPLLTVKTVNEWLSLNAGRYCAVNEGAFVRMVDIVGGVPMELTDSEAEALGLLPGEALLGGIEALRYVRLRRAGNTWERPRKLLQALLSRVGERGADAAFSMAEALLPAMDTNLTTGDLINLIFSLLIRETPATIETASLSEKEAEQGEAWCRRVLYGGD